MLELVHQTEEGLGAAYQIEKDGLGAVAAYQIEEGRIEVAAPSMERQEYHLWLTVHGSMERGANPYQRLR